MSLQADDVKLTVKEFKSEYKVHVARTIYCRYCNITPTQNKDLDTDVVRAEP